MAWQNELVGKEKWGGGFGKDLGSGVDLIKIYYIHEWNYQTIKRTSSFQLSYIDPLVTKSDWEMVEFAADDIKGLGKANL